MDTTMIIKFWGVRGSIPAPGPNTSRYGGNTSCVSINLGSNRILVLDAGTGIRSLGKELGKGSEEIFMLLSHRHWDHIQGFPFFNPIYDANRKIYIFSTEQEKTMICSVIDQMDGAHFPVKSQNLPALYRCITDNMINHLNEYGFNVLRIPTNHPGEGYGFRIEKSGRSVVYLTDNELDPPHFKKTEFADFVKFCSYADLLIHDAQYLQKDLPKKHGWGHSLVSQACSLAAVSNVKHLILFHHDPDRSDDELDLIQENSREWFKMNNYNIQCTVAYEGLTLNL